MLKAIVANMMPTRKPKPRCVRFAIKSHNGTFTGGADLLSVSTIRLGIQAPDSPAFETAAAAKRPIESTMIAEATKSHNRAEDN